MSKRMLYRTDNCVSIPGIVHQSSVYQDKDEVLHILIDDDNGNRYAAYELTCSSTGETLVSLYDEDFYHLKAENIGIGKLLYHSNDFDVSNMSWDEYKQDTDPRESVAQLQSRVKTLENEQLQLTAWFWRLFRAINKTDLELDAVAELQVQLNKYLENNPNF